MNYNSTAAKPSTGMHDYNIQQFNAWQ